MDIDIQKMFQKKNREILIHNLQLDIERNLEILNDSLTNLFELQFSIAHKNIHSIYDGQLSDSLLFQVLENLKNQSFSLLKDSLNTKKQLLLECLNTLEFEEHQMEEYYQLVFHTTEDVLKIFQSEKIEELKKLAISKICKSGKKISDSEEKDIIQYRVRDYIMDRLFGKLKDKVQSELFIRDNNLSNKGKESYEKFQDLEKNTTNL